MSVQVAKNVEDIMKCFGVMHALRPHLKQEEFASLITGMMERGYRLIFIEENGKAVSASGYRYTEHLLWGRSIYVDDLSSLPQSRKKGYARLLLDYIVNEAKRNGCREVHLDSGANPGRYDAHRMYLKYGFNITSFHFALKVDEGGS